MEKFDKEVFYLLSELHGYNKESINSDLEFIELNNIDDGLIEVFGCRECYLPFSPPRSVDTTMRIPESWGLSKAQYYWLLVEINRISDGAYERGGQDRGQQILNVLGVNNE